MTGHIFNIQKFCLHDGPGIRTTVFFKGCNLRCKWCANPESQQMTAQLTLDRKKCSGCGSCVAICLRQARKLEEGIRVDAAACTVCGTCLTECPTGAIGKEGKQMTVEQILTEVEKDIAFYRHSGGGVTLSGGEVLLQSAFAAELAGKLREKEIHVAIETAGAVPETVFSEFLHRVDYVLMDLKHYDSAAHLAGTGVDNRQILANIQLLHDSGVPFLLRIPVIPGFNDTDADAEGFAKLLRRLKIGQVELLPFHQLGQHKYELLRMDYAYAGRGQLHREDLTHYRQILERQGVDVKI